MSTRSILMIATDTGDAGVYVHSDGYPDGDSGRLAVYSKIIERDGVDKFRATILAGAEFGGWSSIFGEDNPTNHLGADRAESVPGYGVRYLDSDNYLIRPEDDLYDAGAEYVYHVAKDGTITWAEVDSRTYASLTWNRFSA
ncbi:hypothetical protein [Mycobacteroides chelonae]|uniref:hypothetical protein n=1 Tax=Mycobacteroides chelonae TaxID=1774 RepID=UPI00104220EB|nr:hypothetical protein [Mycobacteroides chelonae]